MRRSTMIVSFLLVLSLITGWYLWERPHPSTRTAAVFAICDSTVSLLRVVPDTLHLAQQDTAEWRLVTNLPGGSTESFKIIPKTAGQWAFDPTPADSGSQAKAIRHTHMKPNQLHKQYRFNVEYSCTVNGVTKQKLIDPDLIIDLSLSLRPAASTALRREDA